MSKILAVHFLQADMLPHLGHEAKPWKVGETRSVTGTLALCLKGYHYSPTWAAALTGAYLYGPMACIVEVDDDGPKDESKGCSRTRTLVEAFNVEREMRLYAADEASRCLKAWEKHSGKVADIRSWAAVKAARAFADGKITPDELSAAWSEAWSASAARFAIVMGNATGYVKP
jgi:hypothetical protein